ncbi:MAG: hypothetical protein K2X80_00045 [Pseudomonadaceae bacterium]|jgi:hypothetical protein|nr:hypothetical protein [Pseudomonadaceae bacterium]
MAQQNRIAGIDRLEINGQQYTWNETFAAYWSDSGEPRALQEGEIAAWRMDFQSGRNYGPSGHRIEAKIISSQSCPLEGRDVHRVMFLDHTRGVCGYVHLASVTPEALMREYDAGRYEGSWTGAFA